MIIGACGLVGRALWVEAEQRGQEVLALDREALLPGCREMALPKGDGLLAICGQSCAEWVVFAAGLSWVDYCEDHPAESWEHNVVVPAEAASAAASFGAGFIFFSSDYIFDGYAGPYTEEATPHPLSVYGKHKMEAETLVRAKNPNHIIIRTTVIYGPEPRGKNFVYQVLTSVKEGRKLSIASDQKSTPTYSGDLGRGALDLIENNRMGTIHLAGPECLDRYSFALEICRVFGQSPATLSASSTALLNQKAARPLKAGLRTERAQSLLAWKFLPPSTGLQKMKQTLEAAS